MVVDPVSSQSEPPAMTSPATAVAARPRFARWLPWFATSALATLILDLASKQVLFALPAGTDLPSFISLAYNPGVAWSLFAEHPWLVMLLTALLIPVLAVVWWRAYRLLGAWENLAFGCILGGALGNAVDRLLTRLGELHGVRDFIHVDLGFWPLNPWPTFNIADSGICVGFVIIFLLSLRKNA